MAIQDFDFLDFMADAETDQDIVMAANQMETMMANSTTTVMKKTNPKSSTAFTNCTFGNIGTLNIHIHKN